MTAATTPLTSACSASSKFHELESWLASPLAQSSPLHRIEQQQDHQGREVQRLLLQSHVNQRGAGDVGPALLVRRSGDSPLLFSHRRLQRRTLKTVFGEIDIDRVGYGCRGQGSIHPLDAGLQLPERAFSYELQRRLVKAAIQGPFREATARVLESTGLTVHNHSLEPLVIEAAAHFDAFYPQRSPDPSAPTASLLVVAVDGKGIPMVRPEPAQQPVRLAPSPPQKTNKKKMATVAAVFTKEPFVRTPQQVIDSLFPAGVKPAPKQRHPKPENKRVWASLTKANPPSLRRFTRKCCAVTQRAAKLSSL